MTNEMRQMIRLATGGALIGGGIVGAVIGAREPSLERVPDAAALARRTPGLALALARPRYD